MKKQKPTSKKTITLAPVTFDDAVRAALETKPEKKPKAKKK